MRTIAVTPSRSGLQGLMSPEEWQQIVESSVARWNQALQGCCDVQFTVAPAQDRWLAVEDGVNVVVLRKGLWCHNEMCGHTSTFPLQALAMTTAYPEGAKGADVHEADVEINPQMLHAVASDSLPKTATLDARATQSGLWVFGPPGNSYPAPLEAVLVHELGHVLGLSDACVSGHHIGGVPALDNCPAEQLERVMFPDGRHLQPTDADLSELAKLYPAPTRGLEQNLMLLLTIGIILVSILVLWRRVWASG